MRKNIEVDKFVRVYVLETESGTRMEFHSLEVAIQTAESLRGKEKFVLKKMTLLVKETVVSNYENIIINK